jgi:hypothetical protein
LPRTNTLAYLSIISVTKKTVLHGVETLVRLGAYLRGEHLKGASLGYATALPANIRLGFKGLPGPNTLAYLSIKSVSKKKDLNGIET